MNYLVECLIVFWLTLSCSSYESMLRICNDCRTSLKSTLDNPSEVVIATALVSIERLKANNTSRDWHLFEARTERIAAEPTSRWLGVVRIAGSLSF